MAFDENRYRGHFTVEEARAELGRMEKDPEWRAILFNKNDPRHDGLIKQKSWLHQVIAGEPAPAGSTPAPLPTSKAPLHRIFDARKDSAYFDKNDPRHNEVVAQVSAAYAELHPERQTQ